MGTFFNKAIIAVIMPALTTAVLNAVQQFGVDPKSTVGTAITALLTGLMVYLVPNKKV